MCVRLHQVNAVLNHLGLGEEIIALVHGLHHGMASTAPRAVAVHDLRSTWPVLSLVTLVLVYSTAQEFNPLMKLCISFLFLDLVEESQWVSTQV